MKKIKVLYIASYGRSGTTLLERLLGQVNDLFPAGELRYIWERSIKENQLCGCNKTFKDCEVWQRIIKNAFSNPKKIYKDIDKIIKLQYSMDRIRCIVSLKLGRFNDNLKTFCQEYVYPLYSSILGTTDKKIIIDSSKFPSYLYILSKCDFIDLHVIHMIRDSRAVAYSWGRKKLKPEITNKINYMPRYSLIKSSINWITFNLLILRIGKRIGPDKYIQVRYEDMVKDPETALQSILKSLNIKNSLSFLNDKNYVNLPAYHSVSGNPMRFKTGSIKLQIDDEWKRKMPAKDKLLVSLITYPFSKKFYYKHIIKHEKSSVT